MCRWVAQYLKRGHVFFVADALVDHPAYLGRQLTEPRSGGLPGIREVQALPVVDPEPFAVEQLVDDPGDFVRPVGKVRQLRDDLLAARRCGTAVHAG